MARSRKQIAFDMDTGELRKYYPKDHWQSAYEDIKIHMRKNGFEWEQGSVYISQKPIESYEATAILEKLVEKCPWLNVCMRDCVVTNIGRAHSQNHLFDKDA